MKSAQTLQFFSTGQFPCSYLPGRIARNCVIDPQFPMDKSVYSDLIKSGFRRSGSQVYRPQCLPCKECISTRIPVDRFQPSRSQRRNLRLNSDLRIEVNLSGFKPEYADLYKIYLQDRHQSHDAEGVEDFFESDWCPTHYIEFHDNDQLIGVAVVDILPTEISAVYTLFDTDKGSKRGLGTYAVLWEIDYARKLGKPYVYPGYWIKDCSKMNYKSRFQPLEGFSDGRWVGIKKQ